MKLRFWIPFGVSVLAVAIVAAMTHANTPPEIHWKFLGTVEPVGGGSVDEFGWLAQGYYADFAMGGYSNRDGPAVLRRLENYRFKGDFNEALSAARDEALARGGVQDTAWDATQAKDSERLAAEGKPEALNRTVRFYKGTDWQMFVIRTHNGPNHEVDEGHPFAEVKVMTFVKENWVGDAKRWIRSLF